ncbi:MAG: M48 family metallopeptidase [Planctomycetes bacterium]|nr:M48 family metallopeptidase [Planctomycetota bacterium]
MFRLLTPLMTDSERSVGSEVSLRHKWLWVGILLLPFLIWDLFCWYLNVRGEESGEYRRRVLEYFSEADIAAGRDHTLRYAVLSPVSILLNYAWITLAIFAGFAGRVEKRLLKYFAGRLYLALPCFIFLFDLLRMLLYLPLSVYQTFVIEKSLGLSTITPLIFAFDRLKSLGLSLVIGTLAYLVILQLIQKSPHRWHLYAMGAAIAFSAFMMWIYPWVISPIFNEFKPLEEGKLKAGIELLAEQANVPTEEIFLMDASKRSNYYNAYFTGLGSSRRVVLYDTLVKDAREGEVLSVVAHEIGHWTHHHVRLFFFLGSAFTIVGFFVLRQILTRPRLCEFFSLNGSHSMCLYLLLPFFAGIAEEGLSPLASAISRHFERQADDMALEMTRDPDSFIEFEIRATRRAKGDLLYPLFLHAFYGSHPYTIERIETADKFRDRIAKRIE